MNQTQGITSNIVANGNQFSQTGLMRHKAASSAVNKQAPHHHQNKPTTAQANLSGIQRRQQQIYSN